VLSHGSKRLLVQEGQAKTAIQKWVNLLSIFYRKEGIDFQLGIPMTKKKFAELELSLLHLQQNVEIPETHLIIHPIIQRTVEQVFHRFRFS
jgi:hypothetical protein